VDLPKNPPGGPEKPSASPGKVGQHTWGSDTGRSHWKAIGTNGQRKGPEQDVVVDAAAGGDKNVKMPNSYGAKNGYSADQRERNFSIKNMGGRGEGGGA